MIDIVMATYNGSSHVKAQIYSILSQSYEEWNLHIYDDCSTDSTWDMVNSCFGSDSRIHIYRNEFNLGCAKTFLSGIANSNADYVVLCDQDDIWFDSKLKVLFDGVSGDDLSMPVLGITRGYQYDDASRRITGPINMNIPQNINDFLLLNGGLQGCSLIMNRPLIELVKKYPCEVCMHDHFISTLAFAFGRVKLIDSYVMLYRKHGNNVTNPIHGNRWTKIFNYISNTKYLIDSVHYQSLCSIYESIENDISKDVGDTFRAYLSLRGATKIGAISTIIKARLTIKNRLIYSVLFCVIFKIYGKNCNQQMSMWKGN